MRIPTLLFAIAVCAGLTAPTFSEQPCLLGWDPTIGTPGMGGRPVDSTITRAFAVFDDGGGASLYAGGLWDTAGGVTASGVARWNGSAWVPLGSGVSDLGNVYALTVHDDGTGEALYASGSFTQAGGAPANRVAKWDGASWSPVGGGVNQAFGAVSVIVYASVVFDDGAGPALYVAGRFFRADGNYVGHIAKWDGIAWSGLGGGMDGMSAIDRVNALAVFDDGSGSALYAGGMFTGAGGVPAVGIAKWDGASWSDVGGSLGGPSPYARALYAFDDGTGSALYVGGNFTSAGGVSVERVAKWDGATWTALGDGLAGFNPWVTSFVEFDDGAGPALYAGGKFTMSGSAEVNRIAKWNGATWEPLDTGTDDNIYALGVFDDGNGQYLYAGGRFLHADGMSAATVSRWGCSPAFLTWSLDNNGACIAPGTIVTATLSMSKLGAFAAIGCEAYVQYDPNSLAFIGGDYTPAPFGLPLVEPITGIGGQVDLAAYFDPNAGQTPTIADANLVTLTFQAIAETCGTSIQFRAQPATRIVDALDATPPYGQVLLDSADLVIDDTPPLITFCPPDVAVDALLGESAVILDPGQPSALDCQPVTISGARADGQTLTAPYECPGTTITWTAQDPCGHQTQCSQQIFVSVPLDADADCVADIDFATFQAFADCMTGPGGGLNTGCDVFDHEPDGDVDLHDFARFQQVFNAGGG